MSATNPALPSEPIESLNGVESVAEIPQELSTLLTSIRHHLHMNPEIGLQEVETSRFIREMLEMHGLAVQGPIAQTGLFVDIEGAHPGPNVGFRADIDALPIQDAKDAPYASRVPNVAHLCGHDVHTTVGIGVALLLSRLRDRLQGSVRVFFQPNEEGAPSGAPLMIHDGVLDGLEAVYCIHVDPTLEAGRFGLIAGAATAAADRFRVTVCGPGTGHSARPHQSVDTIWVATQIANELYQLIGRLTDARSAAVLTICRFQAGEAYNVIPARAEFGGTLRTTNNDERAHIKQLITHIATRMADLYGADVQVDFDQGSPPVMNDARLIRHIEATIGNLFGEEAVFHIPLPSMGSEDFAHYLRHVPGVLLRVGTSSGPDTAHPLHDDRFDIDEATLAPTAQLMASVLLHHLEQRPLK